MRIETHPVLQKIICNNRTNGGKILNKEKGAMKNCRPGLCGDNMTEFARCLCPYKSLGLRQFDLHVKKINILVIE
jgi:hypothetical protein